MQQRSESSCLAPALLANILHVDERFWDPPVGSCDWRDEEAYRGQNANMHLAEAYLAAFEATGGAIHLDHAESIASLIVDRHARAEGWRRRAFHVGLDDRPRL